ncbi:MAG: GTP cyclohydrolase I FolE [Rickettsiales bacterium]|nr:GTP cyclohydrolase I FolE [Rickettsiales bacterium]|tara:strand:- start:3722 stop:4285 length:564 start_codon:yes stop_codon:yes gene_type:complete
MTDNPNELESNYLDILNKIGEDVNREGLVKTPERAAKSFSFLTKGYTESLDEILNGAIFKSDDDGMILVKNIELYSLCEHHLVPFFGKCHIAYLPNGNIIGLSKIARVVDLFSRRLQVQENLTKQISEAIQTATNALGVAVVIEAHHLCMMMRGVEKQNSSMVTSSMLGRFRSNASTRSEFLSLIKE